MAFTGTFAGDPFKDWFNLLSLFLVFYSLLLVSAMDQPNVFRSRIYE